MKEVYSPANAAEAHMLAHMLDEHGVAAHVMGEQLQGGVGELPAGGFIKLMVADEDHAKARRLILEWERAQTVTPPSETFSPKRRFPIFTAALCFMAGGAVAGFGREILSAAPGDFASGVQSLDQNGDGEADVRYFYRPGAASSYRAEGDNNFDGRPDWRMTFDPDTGATLRHEADQDFDGVFEQTSSYLNGILVRTDIDLNNDGSADISSEYVRGVLEREEIRDPATKRVVRTDHYEDYALVRAEIDRDRDGFAETVRTFDFFGEITSEEARQRPR